MFHNDNSLLQDTDDTGLGGMTLPHPHGLVSPQYKAAIG
jgi:hypothetical protein